MKPGVRPIALGGCRLVPEFPEYWVVPAEYSATIDLLVKDEQVEYEPAFAPAADGRLVEQLQVQAVSVSTKPFARKRL